MAEVVVKLEVPKGLEAESAKAMERVVKEFAREVEFSVARSIVSKSRLTEKQAKKLAEEVELKVAKRHGLV